MRYLPVVLAALCAVPAVAFADAPSALSDDAVCDVTAGDDLYAQATCLGHGDCAPGWACVNPGYCQQGRLGEVMTFADIDPSPYYTYTDGSCNYDTECGPWICNNGWCAAPEFAGRQRQMRSSYYYYDTSCNNHSECGVQQCIDGWCRDPAQAYVFHGSGSGNTPQPVYGGGSNLVSYAGTGYYVSCPANWSVDYTDLTTDIMCLDPMVDGFTENCNVVFENTGVPYDSYSYWNASRASMAVMAGFYVNTEYPVTLNGRSAYRVDYSHAIYGSPMRVIAWFMTNGTMGYVLTCTANPSSIYQYEQTFNQIANTFRFF